jgi:uncharacterized protein (DUF58 family)
MHRVSEFQYRVPWRGGSYNPGSHPGVQRGSGYELHGIAPLHVAGDPRRFDLRASLRDPFGTLLVRVFKQRSVVPVFVLADVSASMSFVGKTRKFDLLIEFVSSLAYSAFRVGDPFSFTACDSVVRDELSLPLTRTRGVGALLSERLRDWEPSGTDVSGLLAGADRVHSSRALVFVVSDFHLPIDLLRTLLNQLYPHAVVPVVLVDSGESRAPGFGLTHLYDPETGARKTILLRRSWARRFEARLRDRHDRLLHCFSDFDVRPLYVVDKFEAEAVSRYFYE